MPSTKQHHSHHHDRGRRRARRPSSGAAATDFGLVLAAATVLAVASKAYLTRVLVLGDASIWRVAALETPLLVALVAGLLAATQRAPRARVPSLLGLNAVLTVALFATAVYAAYFGQILTPATLGLARHASEVSSSVADLLLPAHLLYAADFVLLGVVALTMRLRRTDSPARREPLAARRTAAIALAALLVAALPFTAAWRLPADTNSLAAAREHGILTYQLVSARAIVDRPSGDTVDRAYREALIARIGELRGEQGERIADFEFGEFAGKNLIIVQVEAAQTLLIDLEVDGVEITPNLNALARQGWYFPRTHCQLSRGNTSDIEFVSNTGLYPPVNQAASVRWGAKELPSLPRLLRDQGGYHTATLHPNDADYWNRTNLYPALGFDAYYDRDSIGPVKWKWGVSDEELFSFSTDLMAEIREDGPFYLNIITLTSHHPFDLPPAEYRPYQPSERFAGTSVGEYLSSMSYTDQAIGQFVAELKRTGLWDESVVVFFGDHYGLRRPDNAAAAADLEALLGRPYNDVDYLSTPLIIHLPGQTQGRVSDETVGHVDILATVADPLGVDLTGFAQFGRNAFRSGSELIGMRGAVAAGSMLNGRVLFQPGLGFEDGHAVDVRTGLPVTPSEADRRDYEAMLELLRLSAEYTDALPRRQGADSSLGNAIIPNRSTVSTETPD